MLQKSEKNPTQTLFTQSSLLPITRLPSWGWFHAPLRVSQGGAGLPWRLPASSRDQSHSASFDLGTPRALCPLRQASAAHRGVPGTAGPGVPTPGGRGVSSASAGRFLRLSFLAPGPGSGGPWRRRLLSTWPVALFFLAFLPARAGREHPVSRVLLSPPAWTGRCGCQRGLPCGPGH